MMAWLGGKKAKIGGIGLMLLAVGTLLSGYANGTGIDYMAVAQQFLLGLGVFGIRAKLDK